MNELYVSFSTYQIQNREGENAMEHKNINEIFVRSIPLLQDYPSPTFLTCIMSETESECHLYRPLG